MKSLYIQLILLLFFLSTVSIDGIAQIPNASFESWKTIDDYEVPINWESNQKSGITRLERSTESVDGEFSLKLVPDENYTDYTCESIVHTAFSLSSPLSSESSLFFYIKTEVLPKQDNPYFNAKVQFYKSGIRVKTEYHPITTDLPDFTLQQIQFPPLQIDSVYIEFAGAGTVKSTGLGCRFLSHIWIDNLFIDKFTAVKDHVQEEQLILYPNPAFGHVFLTDKISDIWKYEIYNLRGKLLSADQLEGKTIALPQAGLNVVVLYSRDGKIYTQKIINENP